MGEDDSPEGLGCIWGLALEAGGAMEKGGGPDGLEGCEGGYFQGSWTRRLTALVVGGEEITTSHDFPNDREFRNWVPTGH